MARATTECLQRQNAAKHRIHKAWTTRPGVGRTARRTPGLRLRLGIKLRGAIETVDVNPSLSILALLDALSTTGPPDVWVPAPHGA